MLDGLLLSDICSGVLSGIATLWGYAAATGMPLSVMRPDGPLFREILLVSLIAGQALRSGRSRLLGKPPGWALRPFAVFALLLVVGLMTRRIDDLSRAWVVIWCTVYWALVSVTRIFVSVHLRRLQRSGALRRAVAVIGTEPARERLRRRLPADRVVVAELPDLPSARALARLAALARAGSVEEVLVALDGDRVSDVNTIWESLKAVPVELAVYPDVPETGGHMPAAVLASRPVRSLDHWGKAAFDRAGAALFVLLLAPLLAGIAIAVALDSPGPILFRQRRRGWAGTSFQVLKFRTMHHGTDGARHQTERNDPRVTRVGRFLRRTSLDELPQLFNVLGGSMSLVGPRPHAEELHPELAQPTGPIAEYARRYRVKPGITGWAQVQGCRGAIHGPDQAAARVVHDLYYIENWSLSLDLRILLRTPIAVFLGENAF